MTNNVEMELSIQLNKRIDFEKELKKQLTLIQNDSIKASNTLRIHHMEEVVDRSEIIRKYVCEIKEIDKIITILNCIK